MQANGKDFVARVDRLLVEQKKTKEQIKKECGLSRNSFDCWKARGTIPAADVVYRIAKSLNTSIDFLLFGIEEKTLSYNTKKLVDEFLELTPENQLTVAEMIGSLLRRQFELKKKDLN